MENRQTTLQGCCHKSYTKYSGTENTLQQWSPRGTKYSLETVVSSNVLTIPGISPHLLQEPRDPVASELRPPPSINHSEAAERSPRRRLAILAAEPPPRSQWGVF